MRLGVDEPHHKSCICRRLPEEYGMVHFRKYEIHDVNSVSMRSRPRAKHLVSMMEQVDKSTPNRIIISSTWGNGVAKYPQQQIVERLEALGLTNDALDAIDSLFLFSPRAVSCIQCPMGIYTPW